MGASSLVLVYSAPLSSSSSYLSNTGYFSPSSLSSLALSDGRVWGRCPLPTVSGRPVFTISSSREGEGGGVLARLKISKTSSRHWGFGVPSTLGLSFLTILLCDNFKVLSRGLLAQRPGDCETDWQAYALLTGDARSREPILWVDAGDTATAAQLLALASSATTLAWELVMWTPTWAG